MRTALLPTVGDPVGGKILWEARPESKFLNSLPHCESIETIDRTLITYI